MHSPRRFFRGRCFALIFLVLLSPAPVLAVSCTLQSQMTDDLRNDLLLSARKIALAVQNGNVGAVKDLTIPSVAAQFDSIAKTIQHLAPLTSGASITIDAQYALDASDLRAAEDAQFFCAVPSSPLHEEIEISQLPPGQYALSLVHATGVEQPQQLALLMQKHEGKWELAGLFARPLRVAGHNSVWYWSKARVFAGKGEKWDAHFYFQTALSLAAPVDFLSTPNLEKLRSEDAAVQPVGLPGEQPLVVAVNGQSISVTGMHPDNFLGQLDLAIHYSAANVSDPVATRAQILDLMKALLNLHPELREGFHGLWVFADAPAQQSFAIEQPMSSIP